MSDRIRIDSADIARAPAQPAAASRKASDSPASASGEVFGHVRPAEPMDDGGVRGLWSKPKLLFTLAGLVAAIISGIITDGILGFGRYEASGAEVPPIVGLLFMSSYCAVITACIACADDIASGAFERAGLFAGIGLVLGFIGGVAAVIVGGIVMMLLQEIFFSSGGIPESEGQLVLMGMVTRVPAWLVAGALCGLVIGAMGRSMRRVLLGGIGGAIGGLVGGMLFDPLSLLLGGMEPGTSATASRFVGLIVMGAATGFAIAYAEHAAKQAWLAVERGRLIGKQFILYRNPTRIGASYANDVFLFKDTSVQPEHARISRRGGGFTIEALSGALVRVNGQPTPSRALGHGDVVQIGETVMRFNTKA